ncbi:MAG: 4a-hydroxytetrahydrobiopterin dehydratase [Thiotrichales bacterium]|nr:4a-hydroxytetrahydrobiopterin dehydratase [Thiotrichales bacterium]
MSPTWKQRDKAGTLEARFEFTSFSVLRDFLDEAAEVAEKLGHHPNLSFGREHVSVIIYAQSGSLAEIDFALAEGIDAALTKVMQESGR